MKDAFKLGFILFTITAICTGLLGAVNQLTTPIIEANNAVTQLESMQKLLSSANEFVEVSEVVDDLIEACYVGKLGNDTVGYIAKVTPNGYGGAIEVLVGVDNTLQIQGIDILNHAETPGFGANATKESFWGQFTGKTAPLSVTKMAPTENEISAITGATITSDAITSGVNAATAYISEHMEEWGEL